MTITINPHMKDRAVTETLPILIHHQKLSINRPSSPIRGLELVSRLNIKTLPILSQSTLIQRHFKQFL